MAASENRCERMQDMLSLFVDGRLAPADVARVEAHVVRCAKCASYLGFLRATNFVVANRLPDVRPPADLYARIAQMTYERPVRPTWSQRLSRLLAPAPTRWALGTALAAAGIVGVAVLPQRTGDHNVSGHSTPPLAVASPQPTKAAANQMAVAHPTVKKTIMPIVPSVVAVTPSQFAVVAPDELTVTPRSTKTVNPPVEEAIAIAVSPAPIKHTLTPTLPVTKPATHFPDNAPHLAAVNPVSKPVGSVSQDTIGESVRKFRREQEEQQKERNALALASRAMEIGQRKAAAETHEGVAASIVPHEIPVRNSSVATPSASNTIAIAAPTVVAALSSSPRRHTLAGFDEGQKPNNLLAGIKTNQHASINNQTSLNEHPNIPICGDKDDSGNGAIEKQSQAFQN